MTPVACHVSMAAQRRQSVGAFDLPSGQSDVPVIDEHIPRWADVVDIDTPHVGVLLVLGALRSRVTTRWLADRWASLVSFSKGVYAMCFRKRRRGGAGPSVKARIDAVATVWRCITDDEAWGRQYVGANTSIVNLLLQQGCNCSAGTTALGLLTMAIDPPLAQRMYAIASPDHVCLGFMDDDAADTMYAIETTFDDASVCVARVAKRTADADPFETHLLCAQIIGVGRGFESIDMLAETQKPDVFGSILSDVQGNCDRRYEWWFGALRLLARLRPPPLSVVAHNSVSRCVFANWVAFVSAYDAVQGEERPVSVECVVRTAEPILKPACMAAFRLDARHRLPWCWLHVPVRVLYAISCLCDAKYPGMQDDDKPGYHLHLRAACTTYWNWLAENWITTKDESCMCNE
jgi:hypothetical protein